MTRQLRILCLVALAAAIPACASNSVSQCDATGVLCPAGTHCAAAQPICISNTIRCGDAHMDADEECDDGNAIDGDGCSHSCTIEICGNTRMDPGEKCDDGNTVSGDGCSADCKSVEVCGNGITDSAVGEVCDDGNTVSGDGCSADCKSTEICGNGIKDIHEKCDDGGKPGGCNDDCQGGTGCGDGAIDKDKDGNPIEECDDGNTDNSDDCVACRISRCGDGVKQTTGNRPEICDGSSEPGSVVTGHPVLTARCNLDCTAPRCGDTIVNPLFTPPGAPGPEQCDPPNPALGCSATCQFEHCGNGIKDPEEECDGNDFGPGGNAAGETCAADCHIQRCGNGRIDPGEQCDDANDRSGDGCSAGTLAQGGCKIEFCGDGIKNDQTATTHEDCDGGAGGIPTATATCNANCTTPRCGDGIVNSLFTATGATGPEQCDNGTLSGVNQNQDTAACTSTCQINVCGDTHVLQGIEQCDSGGIDTDQCDPDCTKPVCGDGHVNHVAGEACDDGALNGTAASPNHCTQFCQKTGCGNGVLDPGEDCDAGSGGVPKNSAACNSDCRFAKCGDGFPNPAAGEACDEGAANGTLAGPTHCNQFCQFNSCGDGILEPGEQCDDGTTNGTNNNHAGARCNATCQFNVCGDSDKLEGVEACDPGHDAQGNPKDTPACDRDCTLPVCGDGVPNTLAGEQCDDGIHNGEPGHCNRQCKSIACGNGVIDVGEECDDGVNGVQTNSARCNADCTFARCGDGKVNPQFKPDGAHVEFCDKLDLNTGAPLNGVPCDYGDPNCQRCNATCTGNVNPGGPFCGDGLVLTPTEGCDPTTGPALTLPSLLARADSAICDIDCTPVTCGDGHLNMVALETCDDGNTSACGTCPSTTATDCRGMTPITATQATSTVTTITGDLIGDGNILKLDDGFGKTITLEFDLVALQDPNNVSILFAQAPATDAATIASRMVDAINTKAPAGFLITASVAMGGTTVTLTNSRKSVFGNTNIMVTGLIGAANGFVFPSSPPRMAGGAAGDCLVGTGCVSGDDCKSGVCSPTTHQCQ